MLGPSSYRDGHLVAMKEGGSLGVTQIAKAVSNPQKLGLSLTKLSQEALTTANLDGFLAQVGEAATACLEIDLFWLFQLQDWQRTLLMRVGTGWQSGVAGSYVTAATTGSMAWYTLEVEGALIVDDLSREQRFWVSPVLQSHQVVSALNVRIEGLKGPFGMLGVGSRRRREFEAHEILYLQALAAIVALAVERVRAAPSPECVALPESTFQPAREALLQQRLERALARAHGGRESVAVLLLDLDHFLDVSGDLGDKETERLLAASAERLRLVVRAGDTVARLAKDRFAILCEHRHQDFSAIRLADRMQRALAGAKPALTASVGLVEVGSGEHVAAEVMRDAALALAEAKRSGGGRIVRFDAALGDASLARHHTQSEVRLAIAQGRLRLHYQPVVGPDGRICGVEALLRWLRPGIGLVGPHELIPLVEESDLIFDLGRWVIDEACRQAGLWLKQGRRWTVGINLSARQFQDRQLAQTFHKASKDNHLPSGRICFEVTESAVMADSEATQETLDGLKHLGACLAIDDFGTGYSSLSRLQKLPVDYLKLDRSFLTEVPGRSEILAQSTVTLGHSLGLACVAEGVETKAQAAAIWQMGYDLAQGYLFAKPQSPERLERLSLASEGTPKAVRTRTDARSGGRLVTTAGRPAVKP